VEVLEAVQAAIAEPVEPVAIVEPVVVPVLEAVAVAVAVVTVAAVMAPELVVAQAF
jgi:hypothetical protein